MKYYTKNKYIGGLPFRIRLSDGRTKTNPATFTEEDILDAGYVLLPDPPKNQEGGSYVWDFDTSSWVFVEPSPD